MRAYEKAAVGLAPHRVNARLNLMSDMLSSEEEATESVCALYCLGVAAAPAEVDLVPNLIALLRR